MSTEFIEALIRDFERMESDESLDVSIRHAALGVEVALRKLDIEILKNKILSKV